jgi:transcriptional regulator with XRE-family HTH domain
MSELGDAIRAAREARGLTLEAVGRRFGISKAAVNAWETGTNMPDPRKLAALAETLALDPARLVRLAGVPAGGAAPALATRGHLPVYPSADGREGTTVLTREAADWIRCSERLQGVTGAFAFYAIGGAMSPAVEHGDLLVVNPSVPPVAGREHAFVQASEGSMVVLVRRLLADEPETWRVRQFTPPQDCDLPKATWRKALAISEKRTG